MDLAQLKRFYGSAYYAYVRHDCVDEWKSISAYVQWRSQWPARYHLWKRDESKPHGPNNTYLAQGLQHGIPERLVAFLVKEGCTEDQARARIAKISKQRQKQLVNQYEGKCRCCNEPIYRSIFCEKHYAAQANPVVKRPLTIKGITRSVAEWSKISGVRTAVINARLKSKWSEHDAVYTPVRTWTPRPRKVHEHQVDG